MPSKIAIFITVFLIFLPPNVRAVADDRQLSQYSRNIAQRNIGSIENCVNRTFSIARENGTGSAAPSEKDFVPHREKCTEMSINLKGVVAQIKEYINPQLCQQNTKVFGASPNKMSLIKCRIDSVNNIDSHAQILLKIEYLVENKVYLESFGFSEYTIEKLRKELALIKVELNSEYSQFLLDNGFNEAIIGQYEKSFSENSVDVNQFYDLILLPKGQKKQQLKLSYMNANCNRSSNIDKPRSIIVKPRSKFKYRPTLKQACSYVKAHKKYHADIYKPRIAGQRLTFERTYVEQYKSGSN